MFENPASEFKKHRDSDASEEQHEFWGIPNKNPTISNNENQMSIYV